MLSYCATFSNKLVFCGKDLEDNNFSSVCLSVCLCLLIQYIRKYPPYLESI
jgi:hypothetical protein